MRCLSCSKILSDEEQSRKWENHQEISNSESKYISLCDECYNDAFAGDEEVESFVPEQLDLFDNIPQEEEDE